MPRSRIQPAGSSRARTWTPSLPAAAAPDRNRWINPFNDRTVLAYYREVQAWHGYIRFLGLPHLRDNPDVPIDSLYVTPKLSRQPVRPDQPTEHWPDLELALEMVRVHPRLVVLGDPGSGKSTLVSWIAWHLSRDRTNPWTKALGPLLPLPLIVRELSLRRDLGFEALLDEFLRQPVAAALDRALVERVLETGQCLILLDGLDEVASGAGRRALRRAVLEGVERFPAARWLLTSRAVGYDRVPFHGVPGEEEPERPGGVVEAPGPAAANPERLAFHDLARAEGGLAAAKSHRGWAELVHVAPFDDSQIGTFARNWYVRFQESPAAAESNAGDLVAAIRGNPSTLRLARVPNLLTLMALIHRIQARLPHGRAVLYGKIVEAYLESIDAYRGIQELDYTLEEKARWLAWVGFRMQRRRSGRAEDDHEPAKGPSGPEVLVNEEDLLSWMEEAMARSPRTGDVAEPGAAARAFVDYIARRSGLLLPRSRGQYAFTHLSFQEFFAALHLEERITSPRWFEKGSTEAGDGPEDLQAYADQDAWREPLVLLFGLLAGRPEWSEELVKLLCGKGFSRLLEDERCRHEALARFLAEISTDPHAGLPGDLRKRAWQACSRWELRRQSSPDVPGQPPPQFLRPPQVLQRILAADPGERAACWESFLTVARDLDVRRLTLAGTHLHDTKDLAALGALETLVLDATAIDDLSPLAVLQNLETLDLFDTRVTDLSPLAELGELRWLNLASTPVTDLSPLAELQNLQGLNLTGTPVTELSPLAELQNLQVLFLSGREASDFSSLRGLKNLEALQLSDTRVTDLSILAGLEKLRWLRLSNTRVTELSPLTRLKNLQRLYLDDTRVADLSPLAQLQNLQELDLSDTRVADLSPLAQLQNLQELHVSGTPVADLSPLAELQHLHKLDLFGTRVTDLSPLAGLKNLQGLYLDGTRVADLSPLAQLQNLQELDLDSTQVTDLSPLAGLQALQELYLSGTRVDDLSPLAGLQALQELYLFGTRVDDLSPLAHLKDLHVFGSPGRDEGKASAPSPREPAKART